MGRTYNSISGDYDVPIGGFINRSNTSGSYFKTADGKEFITTHSTISLIPATNYPEYAAIYNTPNFALGSASPGNFVSGDMVTYQAQYQSIGHSASWPITCEMMTAVQSIQSRQATIGGKIFSALYSLYVGSGYNMSPMLRFNATTGDYENIELPNVLGPWLDSTTNTVRVLYKQPNGNQNAFWLTTTSNGTTWTTPVYTLTVQSGFTNALNTNGGFIARNQVVMAWDATTGPSYALNVSTDGGATFNARTPGSGGFSSEGASVGNIGTTGRLFLKCSLALTGSSQMLVSSDSGVNWVAPTVSGTTSDNVITMPSAWAKAKGANDDTFALISGANFYITTNGGSSFTTYSYPRFGTQPYYSSSTTLMRTLTFRSSDSRWVGTVTNSGVDTVNIVSSTDNGANWSSVTIDGEKTSNGIAHVHLIGTDFFVVTRDAIFKSSDASTWTKIASNQSFTAQTASICVDLGTHIMIGGFYIFEKANTSNFRVFSATPYISTTTPAADIWLKLSGINVSWHFYSTNAGTAGVIRKLTNSNCMTTSYVHPNRYTNLGEVTTSGAYSNANAKEYVRIK